MKTHTIKATVGKDTRDYSVEGPHETREEAIKHLQSVVPGIQIAAEETAEIAIPASVAVHSETTEITEASK